MRACVVVLLALLKTFGAAKECLKETRYGYNYDVLYKLDPFTGNGASLEFLVKTDRDAHILFAPNADETEEGAFVMPTISASFYLEVIIGGDRNTKSTIRTGYLGRMTVRATAETPGILSGAEYRGFWVHLTPANTVQVGRVGEDAPFLKAPIPVAELDVTAMSFYSLGSWSNVLGHWRIHCPDGDHSDLEVEEEQPVKQQMSFVADAVELKRSSGDESDGIECMEVSRYGYNYDVMYEMPPRTENGHRLEFLVKSNRDAHLLFSPNANTGQDGNFVMPTAADTKFIEVVIGGDLNKFTSVRAGLLGRFKVVQAVSTPNILSGAEYRGFWVQLTPANTVQVGSVGEDAPFLEAPIPVAELDLTAMSFYSLGSWSNVLGHWRLNCIEKPHTEALIGGPEFFGAGPIEYQQAGDDDDVPVNLKSDDK